MKKAKIIISLAVTAAISVTGVCALANSRMPGKKGSRPSFKMTQQVNKRPELTEEQKAQMETKKAEMLEEAKARLSEKLTLGEITQEEYDNMLTKLESGKFKGKMGRGHKPDMRERKELSEEQKAQMETKKAEMLEEAKARLSEKLTLGEITQEEYDNMLEKLESGKFEGKIGRGHKPEKREKPSETDENNIQ